MPSWLSSGSSSDHRPKPVKDVIKYMYPKSTTDRVDDHRTRFSTLLLEHGEKALQDWAVLAYSSPWEVTGNVDSSSPQKSDKIQWAQSKQSSSKGGSGSTSRASRLTSPSKKSHRPLDKDQFPSMRMTKIEGRLHLCPRSLVFEPTENSRGIVRCPFHRMEGPPVEYPADTPGFEGMCVELFSRRHFVMKANNVVGPFEHVSLPTRFRFSFLHSPPSAFCDLCDRLFSLAMANKGHATTPELDAMIKPMLDRPFHPDNFVDVREQPLTTHLPCQILTPLQSHVGTLVLTTERIYFQPAAGILEDDDTSTTTRAIRWMQRDVVATARRYNGLRDSALEIYWKEGSSFLGGSSSSNTSSVSSNTSTLLAFQGRHDREQVLRLLPSLAPCVTDREFVVQVAKEWHQGNLSNYDYLLALNSAAGRSFHDLSRYPVFPWVIGDYESSKLNLDDEKTFRDLSKPVGALNEERLKYFQTRLEGMKDMGETFLYGTHYSAPGYVLYYLVRSMPEHMLCLQNGKFDSPDRMFHSIQNCFKCVLSNHADVKELIPEFYNAGHDFDFLINARGLSLGATQNGDRVDDVKLPPWARSGRDFIKKNRKALESPICTKMLPRWIDLIFGSKSRGDAALEAANLFHQMAYLGPRDLADMQTEQERYTAELQATEFGIVPDQLFVADHPTRDDNFREAIVSEAIGRASSKEEPGREAWELLDSPIEVIPRMQIETKNAVPEPTSSDTKVKSEKESQAEAASSTKSSSFLSQPKQTATIDRKLPLRGTGEGIETELLPSGSFGEMNKPKAPMEKAARTPSPKVDQLANSSSKSTEWDMKVVERQRIHSDAVSGCVLWLPDGSEEKSLLVTTSLDGGLSVHKVTLGEASAPEQDKGGFSSTFAKFSYSTIMSRGPIAPAQSKLTEYRTHSSRDPLASLVLASDGADGHVAFAGGHDDVVLAYGISSACAVASVYSHRDAVTGLDLITRTPFDSESVLWPEKATHIMVSGSWDATVKVWSATVAAGETVTIHRDPLAELFDAESGIVCTSSISVPTGGIVIASGCADGSFCVWEVHNDGVQVVLHNEAAKRGLGPCSVVQWVAEGGNLHLFAAFSTGKVASYTLTDGKLRRVGAVSVGVAILSMKYSNGVLLVGCSDGGLRLIPVRPGSSFGSKPTLWAAVNHKGSPGISCISVTYTADGTRRICCTGGEDGSILVFELTRAS